MDEGKDVGWATWTCKLGWPVQGIFQGVDYSDVNTVCRSNNKLVLATGDDNGKVNLFKYPVVVEKQVNLLIILLFLLLLKFNYLYIF